MKVLLVQPPIEDFYDTSIRTYPLGLLYVASRVSSLAETIVFDARTGVNPKPLASHGFTELDPYYKDRGITPFSFFGRYKRFGLTKAEIRARIGEEKPDIVGVASMCTAYEREALEVAEAAKEVNRDIVTVVGGVHPTLCPLHVLAKESVDYCIRGEGETPFFELVTALSGKGRRGMKEIHGLCFRQEDAPHLSGVNVESDIDLLPARHLVEPERYRIGRKRYSFLLTSRGCPNSCGFCGKPPIPYRQRNLKSVKKEMDTAAALGVEAIDFEDDMLNLDKGFFADVLKETSGRGLTLSAMNGIYPGNMDAATLRLMHDAGFRRLNFSLVDVSKSVLRRQGREQQQSFMRLLPFLEASSFLVEVHFIIGLPGQDPENLLDTILLLMGKRVLLGPSLFYLAPGSPLHAEGAGHREEIPFSSMRSSIMLPFNPLFPRTMTFTFVKIVRFVNYVKGLLDSGDGLSKMSDLPGAKGAPKDPRERAVVETLLRERRFVCYDQKEGGLSDEPVEPALVRRFFERAKGSWIMGYKTRNRLVADV